MPQPRLKNSMGVRFSVNTSGPEHMPILCLQDLIRELLYHGLDVFEVENESTHYGRTMFLRAERLEENKDMIVARWGEKLFRTDPLSLWGGAEVFPDMLQTYHVVARRGTVPRRRPNPLRRWLAWVDR
jgi:cyclopropane-fatty-acyl-phospholipid synthase